MKGLVDYTSSDSDNEELDYDINQSKKHKETPYSEKNNEKRKAEETDKPVETNKKRGSVLTPTVTTKKLPPLPLEFLELYQETNFRFPNTQEISGDSKLHISLSRPLFLKYFQIERFWDNLRKGFEDKKRNFTNDEKTRSFLALEVGKGINELKTLLEHVNKVAKDFRQEEFYENPRFHASILWSVGDNPIYESLRDALINSGFEDIIRDYVFIINKM
ncbi:13559_t:CDS:2, partial [Gigaspora rosea]